MEEIVLLLSQLTGIPYAYDHFAEGEAPTLPYVIYYYPDTSNFAADDKVYKKINNVHIELYTDKKEPATELRLETVLDNAGIFYNKSEVWIESEKLYEVLYSFFMEVNDEHFKTAFNQRKRNR